MGNYITAMLIIPGLLFAWLVVQFLAREFARRHPEFGPAREDGEGCGGECSSSGTKACPLVKGKNHCATAATNKKVK